MTWQEAIDMAARVNNFPPNITMVEIEQYRRYQAEVWFNEHHHINDEKTECLRNAKHQIIFYCMERREKAGMI